MSEESKMIDSISVLIGGSPVDFTLSQNEDGEVVIHTNMRVDELGYLSDMGNTSELWSL